jgi:CelD/BcsL family acetyltransferase involved in cellulose biosynthesis
MPQSKLNGSAAAMAPICAVSSTAEVSRSSTPRSGEREKTVFEIDPLRDPRWQGFVEWHADSSAFHRVEWLRALHSCYGYAPRALTLTPPGSPLENGLLFCEVRSSLTGNRLVSLPFSDHCEPLVGHPEELEVLLSAAAEKIDAKRWKYFEIRPLLRVPGLESGMTISENFYFHRLDLRPSEQTLFKRFHKDSVQRKVRRAEREGLRCEEGFSDLLLRSFYRLLVVTRRRQGLPPQPLKWFRSLIACMGTNVKIRVAFKGETPLAGILTISHKRTLIYKYGCSDSRFHNLGGMALLFWNAIQDAKANGMEDLDMGRTGTENAGLATFKERWGAERSTVTYWRFPIQSAHSKSESLIKYASRFVPLAPNASLELLGKLLYRHIG